ncbi:leucine-rich repeat domain-containing protein [Dysgonomonas sp. 25]|uniref:leucine-rich repeat domain-containing protein n=1 Tax=Dysgonomonas sp. 25 TaxID=2302933 RepID=UPI0013D34A72|nr:hypothetical protein [Dysgonomonas sp. 25]NDV70307.1 hypothetical protein [Dysgonomonas sp. 25]
MKRTLTQAIIILALFTAISLQAQVTIGSAEPPVDGALLDLKEHAPDANNATAKHGLGLPKVELSDLSKLKIGTAPEITGADALNHTGLIVYNTKETMCFSKGLYVWDGATWVQLSGSQITKKGSYAEDVQALKDLYNANPGNTLGWNLSGDPANFAGVTWTTICGEKRATQLNVFNKKLTFATGIGKLYALTYLDCGLNQLTTLDVSSNMDLTELSCGSNPLMSLDVSSNMALTILYCQNNQLTTLDVSANTALITLYCNDNQLTTLDVSANTALTRLNCTLNQLTSLNISANMALIYLDCGYNQLTGLDVSANMALTQLVCRANQLTSLDVSTNTALTKLYCDDNQLIQAEVNKFKLHPNYCPNISWWYVTPQYFPGTTTIDPSVTKPTCP